MTTYREYQNQIEDLQRKAATARKEEIGTTIRDMKKKIAEFGLTAADLGLVAAAPVKRAVKSADKTAAPAGPGRKKRRSTAGKKVAPKYRGPAGEQWTGRGRQPGWVVAALNAGGTLNDLLIK